MKGLAVTATSIGILQDTDLASYRLERLISIHLGEIPGIPSAGSKLRTLFWQPLDVQTCLDIIDEIKVLVSLYEPNIAIKSISASIMNLNPDASGIIIEINAELVNNKKSFGTKIIRVRDNN
jgi:phage baseplate assembly protein W